MLINFNGVDMASLYCMHLSMELFDFLAVAIVKVFQPNFKILGKWILYAQQIEY